MVRRAETLLVWSDVGSVPVTSVAIKKSKHISLRDFFFLPHFVKQENQGLPLHIYPTTCDGGVIGDHCESVIETWASLCGGHAIWESQGTEGNITPLIVHCITITKGSALSDYKAKNSGMKWKFSADKNVICAI